MVMPVAFTVHRVARDNEIRWPVDGSDVECFWLPLIGPTPYAMLRMFDRDLAEAAVYFDSITYRLERVAERLGIHVKRAEQTLYRLRRFRLIEEDSIDSTYDHPVFIVDRTVRAMTVKEWRRLPSSIRVHELPA